MPLRKRTDGRLFQEDESIEFDEMQESPKLPVAGDPSDSDPGYEVPQILTELSARN